MIILNTAASICRQNMLANLSLYIICPSKMFASQLFGYSAIRLFGYSAIGLFGYSAIRLVGLPSYHHNVV